MHRKRPPRGGRTRASEPARHHALGGVPDRSSTCILGPWLWPVGPFLGDPRWRGVDSYLLLRHVMAGDYPLTGHSIAEVLDAENFAGRLID